ncbi:hypothetical protein Pla175_27440 [Pirellulimonas nuda]|uniref:Uncharacterized protein n=1 Tax=Pirellulimonas nuda TaxID=2528009 RepID=A0A518DCZ5_9BACT|nr:exosortase-associated EpsI family protein [Pirellulimonas nuda]QDU89355.1 hypothetical protein Pla175_27440 [Pirellulimonas nuda]
MKTRFPWIAAAALTAVVALTVGPAVLHGSYSNRWGVPASRLRAAESIGAFPSKMGAWEVFEEGKPLSEGVQRELGLAGYVHRYYRHAESGKVAMLLLMVGQPGPLVRHPPDICYGSRANKLLNGERMEVADADSDRASEFRVLTYKPNTRLREDFRVAFAFTSDGTWAAPGAPRVVYGGEPLVYKVQIQLPLSDIDPDDQRVLLKQLLGEFVAAFDRYQAENDEPSGG